ncbi:hypothetical protein FS749_005146 [Ceratobasidium sp. UAMH 11750]|nr:hypothetical protein FS749_005146 [Ceratobasidium sp. UAMH 11750]
MSVASVTTIHPDDMFTSVVNYPRVVSCPALQRLKVGIAASYDYLCCIKCPRLRLLKLSSVLAHAHSHMKNKRAHSTNAMLALFSKYNVYNGRIADLPVPPYPSPPLPFLLEVKGVQCMLCEHVGVRYTMESAVTMANHLRRGDVRGMAVDAGAGVGVVRHGPDTGGGVHGVAVVGAAREADLPLQMRDRGKEQGEDAI